MADSEAREKKHGIIQQVIGAVLDIKFSSDDLPALNNAIEIPRENGETLVVEVAQHPGDDVVRCWVRQVVSRNIHGLDRCDRSLLRRRDPFLQRADLIGQRGLIPHR